MGDTFERSCEHWSEAGRREMEDFYSLATVDYRHLAESRDWRTWFEQQQARVGNRPLRLLDVACGSGKFPRALSAHTRIANAEIRPVNYSLLDPSPFSISEARSVLASPFRAGDTFETTLQAFDGRGYDVVWATHALYALPPEELKLGLKRFLGALNGEGFIAHASHSAHYVAFYARFLAAMRDGRGTPYTSAEQIEQGLIELGAQVTTRTIAYENRAPESQRDQVEGFLQRCIFDDSVTLDEMLQNAELSSYLNDCLREGEWRFSQTVHLITVTQ